MATEIRNEPPAPWLSVLVGIGASDGGLNPLQTILAGLPTGRGLAVVIAQHVETGSDALLTSLLAEKTAMKIVEAADGLPITADHVYVLPAEKQLSIIDGRLSVQDVSQCQGLRMPIDHFFCTLAVDQGRRAVGIVLSGTGEDGTHGLAEIKALGGVTAAQDLDTALFAEMPHSAIEGGVADVVLAPDQIAAFLAQRADELAALTAQQEEEAALEAVLAAVRTFTGHDFHCYKHGTLERRIRRRMGLRRLDSYDDYARLLRTDADEVAALRKDLLIGVTEFFRQAEAWRVLEEKVVSALIAAAKPQATLRMWVPACSSGKEAYSLAILMAETIERSGKKLGLQIFATDADAAAVDVARAGQYAEEDMKGISQARLRRFFTRKNGRYEVVKQLRELIIFAPQDLTSDPPFSKLDLVSCRNLLIYLDPSVQKKIIHLFHFALREGGFLFLGSAENINGQDNLFDPVSQKWRIYRKLGVATPVGLDLPLRPASKPAVAIPAHSSQPRQTLPAITHQAIAERFGPPSAVVDRKGVLLYMHGPIEDYLQLAAGEHTGLLANVAREGLRNRLASTLLQAVSENKKVTCTARVKKDKKSVPVKITVCPMRHPREAEGLLLVTFEPQKLPKAAPAGAQGEAPHSDLRQIEDELKITREELSSTIEQLEQSNEHLKASNEEVTSANEELQSANEELETSKEELQSLNEELNAVNQRLQDKVVELEEAGNDVTNLLTSGDVATIFLDREFKVRRFTPAITKLLSLINSDIGRPFLDITRKFHDETLLADARQVLADLSPAAAEVQAEDGKWYSRRILPYRTRDERIDGVVITFSDVTEFKQLTVALRASEAQARWLGRFPAENPNPVVRAAADGTVLYRNPAAAETPGWQCEVGQPLPQETLRRLLGQALADGKNIEQDVELGGIHFTAAVAPIQAECYANIYGRDITERRRAEEALRQSEEQTRLLVNGVKDYAIFMLDPEGLVVSWSEGAQRVKGWTAQEIIGQSFSRFYTPDAVVAGHPQAELKRAADQGNCEDEGWRMRKDGSRFWASATLTALRDDQGRLRGFSKVTRDITERKLAETNQRLATEILRVLNRGGDLHSLMGETVRLVRESAGFDAVGLRMRMGDDCPYYAQDGFSDDFLREENFLCEKRDDGSVVRNAEGRAILECTCGLMLSVGADPSLPFFTEGGSFWTNKSPELLALTPEVDPRTKPRNRCIHEGYQSIALVPVRAGEGVIGLLQLNDRREGRFTPDLLRFLEGLADNIGLALQRKAVEEALRQSEERFRTLFTGMTEGFAVHELITDESGRPIDYRFLDINPAFERLTGLKRRDVVGRTHNEVLPGDDPKWLEMYAQVALTGQPAQFENFNPILKRHYEVIAYRPAPMQFAVVFMEITERKAAEEALSDSERRLARSQEIAHLGSWELDVVADRLAWSDEVYRIFGLEPQEFGATYEAFLERIHPDDRAAVDAAYSSSLREGRDTYEIEHRVIRKDNGEVRFVHERCEHARDAAGRIIRSLGMVHDITERKAAEEELRKSRDELEEKVKERTSDLASVVDTLEKEARERIAAQQALLRSQNLLNETQMISKIGGWELDVASGRVSWTDEVYRIHGLPKEYDPSNPQKDIEFYAPEDRRRVAEALRRTIEEGEPYDLELQLVNAQGVKTWVRTAGQAEREDGRVVRVFGNIIDLTERKQAEAQVKAERQRLYNVLETLPVYVILLTPDYHVSFANRFFRERFGESNGKRCYEYLFNRREPCEICETYTVLKTSQPHHWYWTGPDGRNYDIYDYPFTDSDGSSLILEMGIDITERKQAEAALLEAKQTLEQRVAERTVELARSNENLEQFAYVASHDLQEPLRMVNSFLKLLEERYKPQLDAKAREYIAYSVDGATRMSHLITDLLLYSRMEKSEKNREPTDIDRVLEAAMANLQGAIQEAGATVTHDELPTVKADATQLMQLLQNLIGNAIKFHRDSVPPQVHVGCRREGRGWLLWVKDNGIGIEPESRERVFMIFQRLHGRKKYAGTGIGLAICKRIVEQHDGRIWIESTPGEGSTFYFTLPGAPPQE